MLGALAVGGPFAKLLECPGPNSNEFYSSYSAWRTHQMSDHLPMWVELHIDFADDYLNEVESDLQASIDA